MFGGFAARRRRLAAGAGLALLLAACGGGGGGGEGGGAATPAVTFAPGGLVANVQAGTSATLTVRATATDAALFSRQVYVFVIDSAGVLLPSIELAAVDSRTVSATLHTQPTLAVGRHAGEFSVRLCNDIACASQVAGSPVPLPYDLTVTPAPLTAVPQASTSFTVHRGGALATTAVVQVGASTTTAWTATPSAAWIRVTPGSGSGPGPFSIGLDTPALAEGRHEGEVVVRSSDGQTVRVAVSLDVLATQFVLTSGVPSFSAINGAPIAAQPLGFALDNGVPSAWSASTTADWLLATPTSGTTPSTISLQPDPARGLLASGNHQADLVLASAGVPSRNVTTQLALSPATLSTPTPTLTLGGPKGRDTGPVQASVSLNTGANAWPFTLSALPAWLGSSTGTGAVAQSGASLSFAPQLAAATPGSTSATVTMTARVNGDTVALPLTVNLNLDQRRLLPSQWGVGLAATPTGAALTRTLTIRDNFGGTLAWTASSSAPWLSVTASGSTGGASTLTLSADPAALANGSLNTATVTVSTATPGVQPAQVRVALWKNDAGLGATAKLGISYGWLVADAIRPYVYAHDGGTSIDVYHGYSAQKIATIANVGSALGQMAVSPDGSLLYALDTATRTLAVVDLATQTRTGAWPLDFAVNSFSGLQVARPNGVDVVLVGDGTAYVDGRRVLGEGTGPMGAVIAATADGLRAFNLGGSRHALDYSAMAGGTMFATLMSFVDVRSGGNPQDIAVSRDGSRIYGASGGGTDGGYKCGVADGATGSFIGALPGGDAYPNNVEVTSDGRPICGISGWYATYDFWLYTPAGALLQGYKVAGYAKALKAAQLVVLPDGLVVVTLTDDPLIAFVPIGAP
ncbi:MAG: BACON domain-containing protein [Burkholderiales bacterium]|nr:BACON domain-containing protein [Burkholderiales bacterium]